MAKRLQHRGGTTSQHSTFTGAVREVTVDTDKNTLVVHDGATAGGHPLATATNFTSTGIDDNATSTVMTVDDSQVTFSENIYISRSINSVLRLESTASGIGAGVTIGAIQFYGNDASSPGAGIKASIVASTVDSLGDDAQLNFTTSSGSTNNVNRMVIARNGDIAFYEDTGTTPKFLWDASTERLGIGTSSPDDILHINTSSPSTTDYESGKGLIVNNTDTATGTITPIGFGWSGSTGSVRRLWGMGMITDNASNAYAHLAFYNQDNERLRINRYGNTGIGNTGSATVKLSVTGSSNNVVSDFNRLTSDGEIVKFYKDGTAVGSIGAGDGDLIIGKTDSGTECYLRFGYSAVGIVPANLDGSVNDNALDLGSTASRVKDIYLGGGLYVGGTGSANKLDDYEEGLHTVTATDTGGGATITMNTSYDQLAYTKIGRVVHIQGVLLFSSISGTFSGTLQISLPFTASNLTDLAGRTIITLGTYNVDFTSGTTPYLSVSEDVAYANLRVSGDNIGTGEGRPQGSGQLYIGGSYLTNA